MITNKMKLMVVHRSWLCWLKYSNNILIDSFNKTIARK